MQCLKTITTICILSSLMVTAGLGQNRTPKPTKKKSANVIRQIQPGTPLIITSEPNPAEKPYLSEAEAGCPRFCAFLVPLTGAEIEPKVGVHEITNQQRFSIKLLLRWARVQDREYLSMASEQGSANPGGPTVILRITKMENGRLVDIPVRVSSLGGSRSLSVLRLSLRLNISYPDEVKKKRARRMAEEIMRFYEEESARQGTPVPHMPTDVDALASYLSPSMPDHQPGEYELRFTYRRKGNYRGNKVLKTKPLRIRVVEDDRNPFKYLFSPERTSLNSASPVPE